MSITTNQQGSMTDRTPYRDDNTPLLPKNTTSKLNTIKRLAEPTSKLLMSATHQRNQALLSARGSQVKSTLQSNLKFYNAISDVQEDRPRLKLDVNSLSKQTVGTL